MIQVQTVPQYHLQTLFSTKNGNSGKLGCSKHVQMFSKRLTAFFQNALRLQNIASQTLKRPRSAPTNSRLNKIVRFPTPFRLGRNSCWSSRGS